MADAASYMQDMYTCHNLHVVLAGGIHSIKIINDKLTIGELEAMHKILETRDDILLAVG